jgi:chromosome segregation ATPase
MILTVTVIIYLLHPMHAFLLAPDKPGHPSGGNNNATSMSQRLDALQRQMAQQNKTLKMQDQVIKQLLETLSGVNQSLSTLSSLGHHNQNQLSTFSSDLHTTQNRLHSLQGKVSQNQHQVSSLSSQCSAMSANISTFSSDFLSVERNLTSLQRSANQNRHYSSNHISNLTRQFSTLSTSLQTTKTRVSTLEHNLEETLITSKSTVILHI